MAQAILKVLDLAQIKLPVFKTSHLHCNYIGPSSTHPTLWRSNLCLGDVQPLKRRWRQTHDCQTTVGTSIASGKEHRLEPYFELEDMTHKQSSKLIFFFIVSFILRSRTEHVGLFNVWYLPAIKLFLTYFHIVNVTPRTKHRFAAKRSGCQIQKCPHKSARKKRLEECSQKTSFFNLWPVNI